MINGSLLRLKLGLGAPVTVGGPKTMLLVSEETKTDLNFKKETWEGTNKDSERWKKRYSSFKELSIQCEAFVDYNPVAGRVSFAQMYAAQDSEDAIKAEFATGVVGATGFLGDFILTDLNISAQTEQGATLTFTLISTGVVTNAVQA